MSFISDIKKTGTTIGGILKQTYGPLAKLELPFNVGNTYRYPLDVGDSNIYPHTIELQAWLPEPVPVSEVVEGGVDAVKDAIAKVTNNPNIAGALRAVDQDTPTVNRNQKYNPRLLDFTRRAKRDDLIVLYLPNSPWDDTVDNSYNAASMTEAFGNVGLAVEAGATAAEAYTDSGGGLKGVINGIKAAFNSPAATEVVADKLGGEAGKNLALAAQGYAINPQEEMLYGGTSFRSFMFEFTMTPRNIQEAQSIRDIIKRLKYHASPQFGANQGRWVIPPSMFDISFMFNGSRNTNLPKISTCALTQVRVNYSGGLEQWATYEDGMPISVQLALSFTELEMMHKDLRLQGY